MSRRGRKTNVLSRDEKTNNTSVILFVYACDDTECVRAREESIVGGEEVWFRCSTMFVCLYIHIYFIFFSCGIKVHWRCGVARALHTPKRPLLSVFMAFHRFYDVTRNHHRMFASFPWS